MASYVADITGSATIDGLRDSFTVENPCVGIHITDDISDDGTVLDAVMDSSDPNAVITIAGAFQEGTIYTHNANNIVFTLTSSRTHSGTIVGPADSSYSGTISISDDPNTLAVWRGRIEFYDFAGTLDIGSYDAATDLSAGGIRINHHLLGGAAIDIVNTTGVAGAFVTVDFAVDPNDPNETPDPNAAWDPNATVTIEGNRYTGNHTSVHVYNTTPHIGDMNNDDAVNFGDIDPFVLGVTDAPGYADTYAGLAGSMVYHGDINDDDAFNFGDIDPFVALITGGKSFGAGGDAESLAAMLAATLSEATLALSLREPAQPAGRPEGRARPPGHLASRRRTALQVGDGGPVNWLRRGRPTAADASAFGDGARSRRRHADDCLHRHATGRPAGCCSSGSVDTSRLESEAVARGRAYIRCHREIWAARH